MVKPSLNLDRTVYPNPPIHEAVCEFRFEGFDWDPTIPGRFYDQIKNDYPEKPTEVKLVKTQVTTGPQPGSSVEVAELPSRTRFSANGEQKTVLLGPGSLAVVERRPYGGWETFKPRIESAFRHLEGITGELNVSRIGIRYVNKLMISLDEGPVNLHEYFECAPQDLSEEGHEFLPSFQIGVLSRQLFSYSDGSTLLRVLATIEAPTGHLGVLLDLDASRNPDEANPVGDIMTELELLRNRQRAGFEASIKDECRNLFG